MINHNGIIQLSKQIDGRCQDFVKSINPGNNSASQQIASQTLYDCQILQSMVEEPPQWLLQLIEQCGVLPNVQKNDYLVTSEEIVKLFYEAKSFDWNEKFALPEGSIEYDKLFDTYKAQSKLDNALEQLINCLGIILNEPTFNLDKKTKEDIKVVMNSIRANKNSSDSAIRSAVASFYGLMKTIVPYLETGEKWVEFSGKLNDACAEIYFELANIRLKIQERVKQEFLNDNFFLPQPEDIPSETTLLLEPENKKESSGEVEQDKIEGGANNG